MNKCPTVESGLAGKGEGCKGCPNAKICASSRPDEDINTIKTHLLNLKCKIAILSGKGGVGKSIFTKNLAETVSNLNYKTIVLDLDLSGPSIPRLTNTMDYAIYNPNEPFKAAKINENLSAISMLHLERFEDSSFSFNSSIKNFFIKSILKNCDFSNFDFMVIDTPPNITDEHLAIVNYIKPDYAIIVTTPQNLSFDDAQRQISFCNKSNIPILGVVENMKNFSCSKCSHTTELFPNINIEKYCNEENIKYLGSLKLKTNISRNSDCGGKVDEELFDQVISYLLEQRKESISTFD